MSRLRGCVMSLKKRQRNSASERSVNRKSGCDPFEVSLASDCPGAGVEESSERGAKNTFLRC